MYLTNDELRECATTAYSIADTVVDYMPDNHQRHIATAQVASMLVHYVIQRTLNKKTAPQSYAPQV